MFACDQLLIVQDYEDTVKSASQFIEQFEILGLKLIVKKTKYTATKTHQILELDDRQGIKEHIKEYKYSSLV